MLEWSRCVAEVWRHPPIAEQQEFVEALTVLCRRTDLQAIFPVGDREIELVVPLARQLPVVVVAASAPIIEICLSKSALLGLADQCCVPNQPWEFVASAAGLAGAASRVGFPAVLKPDKHASGTLGFKAAILPDIDELQTLAARIEFPSSGMVLQRLGQGKRHNMYFVAIKGQMLGCAQFVIHRTDRPDGTGLAVEGESVALMPDLEVWTRALVARLEYTGAGCAQFLVDDDGTACFLEINARLGANCAAVRAAGLDLPRLYLEALLGHAVTQTPVEIGRRYTWFDGDMSGLATCLRSGEIGGLAAMRWFGRALKAQLRADDHITWSIRDPLPMVPVAVRVARSLARALIS